MKRAVTAEQMAQVERAAAERFGISSAVLMENAGTALAEQAMRLAGPMGRFLIVCGRGNNGGDGLVAARKIAAAKRSVLVEVIGDGGKLKVDSRRNHELLRPLGVEPARISAELAVTAEDVVIDALFGTGLNRPPLGEDAEAIQRIARWRAAGARVVSADIPSGVDGNTGLVFVPAVHADATVTFGFPKVGQILEPGASQCGALVEAPIGLPAESSAALAGPAMFLLEESDAREALPQRRADSHKGTYGHVLIVAGSPGKTGAAALSGLGALRGGAGLVTIAARAQALPSILAHAPELMGAEMKGDGVLGIADLEDLLRMAQGKQALVIGPGIATGDATGDLLASLLRELSVPCVLDADGLNAVSTHLELLREAKCPLLLTPHPGEMARLLGKSTAAVQRDRPAAARKLAAESKAVAVLKGSRTVIALPDGTAFVNPTGNPGMATGGAGDVLSGLCGALLAQGLDTRAAAIGAVYSHGLAGDLIAARTGRTGLIATDLLRGIQEVWVRWRR